MKNLVETVIDTEGDGLLPSLTKFHCLSWRDKDSKGSVVGDKGVLEWLKDADGKRILICHNMQDYDLRAFKKVLKYTWTGPVVDTLPLAWYLHHSAPKHGLEYYGDLFGIPKLKIDDWENLTTEEYIARCERDCEINWQLWLRLKQKLQELYDK